MSALQKTLPILNFVSMHPVLKFFHDVLQERNKETISYSKKPSDDHFLK